MQYKFFTIPVMDDGSSSIAEEMNAFIRGHRVLNVQRELINNGQLSCWCCCVEYIEGSKPADSVRNSAKEKVDYRNVLNDEDFSKFRIMRECRKILAEDEAVPAYAVFLDEHLAALAKLPELTLTDMKSVNGIGEKKIEKYGKRFLELWEKKRHETAGQSVPADSGN